MEINGSPTYFTRNVKNGFSFPFARVISSLVGIRTSQKSGAVKESANIAQYPYALSEIHVTSKSVSILQSAIDPRAISAPPIIVDMRKTVASA